MKTENNWKLIPHFSQIADTGDYDGCFELTNGKISLFTKDDDDDTMQYIVSILNQSEIEFFLDDTTHWELDQATEHIKELESELSALKSAKEEVKSAEEILKKYWIDEYNKAGVRTGMHIIFQKDAIEAMHEYATQFQSVQSKEVQLFMDDVHQWADSAFGKERTALAPVYHLKKEVDEVISEMKKGFPGLAIKELADCFILVLNATSKYGYSFDKLFTEAKDKMIINKTRKWGKPDENGVCEHIKDQPVQSVKGEGERAADDFLTKQGYTKTVKYPDGRIVEPSFQRETVCQLLESYKHPESKEQKVSDEFHVWVIPDIQQIFVTDRDHLPSNASDHITFDTWEGAFKLGQFLAKFCHYQLELDNEAGRFAEHEDSIGQQ